MPYLWFHVFGLSHYVVLAFNCQRERHIAARFVFEIIAGEAAGERKLDGAQVRSHESSAAPCIIFLIAERSAFEPERKTRSKAPPDAREAPILLKGRAIGRVG